MTKNQFLLDKLAEECAEVAQAAIKHKHKGTKKSRLRLSREIGDALALIALVGGASLADRYETQAVLGRRLKTTEQQMKDHE